MVQTKITMTADMSGVVSGFNQLGDSIDRVSDKTGKLENQFKNVQGPDVGPYSNTQVANAINNSNTITQAVQQTMGGAVGGVGGGVVPGVSGGNVQQNNGGKSGGSFIGNLLTGGGTKALSMMGPAGLGIAGGVAIFKGLNNLSNQYEKDLATRLDTFNMLSDVAGYDADTNSESLRRMNKRVDDIRKRDNTRYQITDYEQIMNSLGEFGYSNWRDALNSTSKILRFENAGMGSRGQLMEIEGMSQRFGQSNALDKAYAGLEKSGMEKGQFDEFLSSMGSIFEDGISKGFVKGLDEISTELTLLENLSKGNPLWQGQYAAQNLQQMNSAISNATNLSSVEDVMFYRAISGMNENKKAEILQERYDPNNSYLNNQMIMEMGLTKDTIGPILEVFNSAGGSQADQIARLAKGFRLTTTQAYDWYKMGKEYNPVEAEKLANEINGYTTDTSANSKDSDVLKNKESISEGVNRAGGIVEKGKAMVSNAALNPKETFFVEEVKDTDKIKKIPVNGDEVAQWNKLVESYNGPLSKEQLYQEINNYFNDDNIRKRADMFNFQNSKYLKGAWDSGNGTEFFTNLFNPDMYMNTAFGPITHEDWNELQKNKNFQKFSGNIKESKRNAKMEEFEEAKKQSIESLTIQQGMLETLIQIGNFYKNGKIKVINNAY